MICRPVAVVAFTLACGVVVGTAAEPFTAKVVSVHDGDTPTVVDAGVESTARHNTTWQADFANVQP
jgi:endonuclease YncB( thermonuclease family)